MSEGALGAFLETRYCDNAVHTCGVALAREPHVVFSVPAALAVLYNVVHELWGSRGQQLPCVAS